MMRMTFIGIGFLALIFLGCESEVTDLPVLGRHDYSAVYEDGEMKRDTVFYTIPEFAFTDQNNEPFSSQDVQGKIYITDFFFTSCPTICPKMSKNMLELSKHYQQNDRVVFLSHSIDTRHDSVPVLRRYADKLNSPTNWYFVTGDKDRIFKMAENYMVSASEDPHAPGGVIHSGAFILVDQNGRIRAYYDGTKKEEMEKVYHDIDLLLSQML